MESNIHTPVDCGILRRTSDTDEWAQLLRVAQLSEVVHRRDHEVADRLARRQNAEQVRTSLVDISCGRSRL